MDRTEKVGRRSRYWLVGVCGLAILAGCGASSSQQGRAGKGSEKPAEKREHKEQREKASMTGNEANVRQTSPLERLVTVFLSAPQVGWQAFDAIPGVHWQDAVPQDNPDTTGPADARYRSGTLVLSGFGQVPVPDGRQGAEAGVKEDNEGNSGVTLTGDKEHVFAAALRKFYASDDYQAILRQQFGPDTQLTVIADSCGGGDPLEEDPARTRFYAVALEPGVAYVEASLDDGAQSHGPGSTTFVFTKAKPERRITSLGCKEQVSK